MRKKIFILLFLMIVLMSMSAVSAADADDGNDTIVSSADTGALAFVNDVDAIDDLDGNYSNCDTKALENDVKSLAVGRNNEIYGATCEEAEGDSMSPVLGGSTIDPIIAVSDVIYVNASAGPGGDGSEEYPLHSLRDALNKADDGYTIMIAAGTYTGTNNTGLTINDKLSFEKYGDGEAIFDAESKRRIWTVEAGTININGLTFKNGKSSDDGGAIYFEKKVINSNINANFINNTADDCGGANSFKYGLSNVSLSGRYINNTADRGGANSFNDRLSNVSLSGSYINNTADDCGGANSFNGRLSNVSFSGSYINNTADYGDGGANFFNNVLSNVCLSGSYINNTADDCGGANSFNGRLSNVSFSGSYINNTADYGDGGANFFNNRLTDVIVHDSIFINNKGNGILYSKYDSVKVSDSWFGNNANNYNVKPQAGYGITMNNWLFLNATANTNEIIKGENATIVFKLDSYDGTATGSYDASKMNIELNLAQTLGELDKSTALIGEEISYTAKNVGDASVTGKLETASYTINLINVIPTWHVNATAASSGDGKTKETPFKSLKEALDVAENGDIIMIAAGTYTGTNNTGLRIDNNLSFEKYGDGEAIFDAENQWRIWNVNAGTININGLTFKNGKSHHGGAISFNNPLSNSNINAAFINNTAEQGGAILFYKQLTNVNITGNFTNNTASQYHGGAIYIIASSDNVNVYGEFINNEARNFGGAICCNDVLSNSIINATFKNNKVNSNGYGGANFFYGILSNVSLSGSYINNTAGLDGGANYFNGRLTDVIIHDSIFINNNGNDILHSQYDSVNVSDSWFGNNANNYNVKPQAGHGMTMNNWLFLNATANPTEIKKGENATIVFKLDSYDGTATGSYDASKMNIKLNLTQTLGELDKSTALIGEAIVFHPSGTGIGSVTASVENAAYTIEFDFRNNPELSVDAHNVYYSNNTVISLNYNSTATGTVNITLKGKKFDYTFTDMAMNATVSLGKVNPDEYNVTVTYSGDDTFFNVTASGNLTVLSIVDLSVNKIADKDWYYYHDIVVWTITVKNAGNGTNATHVNVTDFFPTDKLEFISCTPPKGTSYNNETHIWTIGDMANGTELVLVIYSRAIVTGDITNEVHVDVKETDWNELNNDDDYTVNVLPLVDVSVQITSDKEEYFIGDIAIWTIIVHNAANGTDATRVNLTEVFPDAFFDIISGITENGTYHEDAGLWDIGFMANGTDATLTIVSRAKIAGENVMNRAIAACNETDWNNHNNVANNTVNVKKPSSSVNVSDITLDYGVSAEVNVTTTGAKGITVKIDGNDAVVDNYTITIPILNAGIHNLTVTTIPDENHTEATKTVNITVNKANVEIILANETLYLKANDVVSDVAKLNPANAGNLTFVSSNEDIALAYDGTIWARTKGNVTVTVSFEGNNNYEAAENKTITVCITPKDARVSVENDTLDLKVNDTYEFSPTVVPDFLPVEYSSSNESVVTVTDYGFVRAVGAGTAIITLTVGNDMTYAVNTTNVTVTVSKVFTEINLANQTVDLKVLDEIGSGATLTPADAGNLTYASGNESVAIVKDGKIMAVSAGQAIITVSFAGDGMYAAAENRTITVNVSLRDAGISVNNSTLELFVDDNFTIVAITNPLGLNVSFVPDDSGVYSVDENGVVTALRNGTGNILVKVTGNDGYAENSTEIAVSVSKVSTEIKILSPTGEMSVGAMGHVGAELNPAGVGNLIYASNDTSVVNVSSTGVIKAVNVGTALVTVSFAGDKKYAAAENRTIAITVNLRDVSISVNNSTLDLQIDDNFTIIATTDPLGLNVSFVPDDSGVYRVDENGVVTALRNGTGNILVKVTGNDGYAENSTEIAVSVSKVSTEIKIFSPTGEMSAGAMGHVGAELNPAGAGNLTYASNDTSVVNVSSTGVIKAVNAGTAIVTVSFAGDKKYAEAENRTVAITVNLNPASVSVNNNTLDLVIGDDFILIGETSPAGLNVTFTSTNSSVVTVDADGHVNAVGDGHATIVVSVGDDKVYAINTTDVEVTVKIPTEITVVPASLDLLVGDETVIIADLTPAGAGNVIFTSSDDSVVIVDDEGNVIADGKGQAIITVSFAGDDKYAAAENRTVNVTVSLNDASVTVENATLDLKVGETYKINATKHPDTILLDITYKSSDSSVASVDENGIVTAVGEGSAVITVEVGDGEIYAKNSTNVTVTVGKVPTEIASDPITATYNVNKELVITLKDSNGAPLSGESISVDLNGAKTYITDNNGQVKLSTKGLTPGNYAARITFNDTNIYEKSAKEVSVTIKKANPKITAKSKTFKTTTKNKKYSIILKDNTGNAIKKATVYLKVAGKTYKAVTNSKGKATFNLKKLTKKGKHNAVITYKGSNCYNKATKKVKITVKSSFKTVSKGSKNSAIVKKIQRALKNNGYYLVYDGYYLKVDGIFGYCTEMAVKEFQSDKKLKVTGKVDEKTAKKLKII